MLAQCTLMVWLPAITPISRAMSRYMCADMRLPILTRDNLIENSLHLPQDHLGRDNRRRVVGDCLQAAVGLSRLAPDSCYRPIAVMVVAYLRCVTRRLLRPPVPRSVSFAIPTRTWSSHPPSINHSGRMATPAQCDAVGGKQDRWEMRW